MKEMGSKYCLPRVDRGSLRSPRNHPICEATIKSKGIRFFFAFCFQLTYIELTAAVPKRRTLGMTAVVCRTCMNHLISDILHVFILYFVGAAC